MKTRLSKLMVAVALTALLVGVGTLGQSGGAFAGSAREDFYRECPYLIAAPECRAEIVSIIFTDQVKGTTYVTPEIAGENREKFRYAIVSVRFTKPAGKRLSVAAADLTLHYYHGDQTEVSPCEGISWFATNPDSDLPIQMNKHTGPGFIKQTTGARCTQASVVYLDALFTHIEPDTRECWICVGQPMARQPYVCPSPAWIND